VNTDPCYGICHIPLIPVRADASHRSEMVTQLLFGETYRVIDLETQADWVKIETISDHYPGWIDRYQLQVLDNVTFKDIQSYPVYLETGLQAIAFNEKRKLFIPFGSRLTCPNPQEAEHCRIGKEDFQLVHSRPVPHGEKQAVEQVFNLAKDFMHVPYLWGGKSQWGLDCSGFTQLLFAACAYALPRDASQQVSQGSPIAFGAHLPGDLAFFQNPQGRIMHVGIVAPEGNICHASSWVRTDRLDEKGILNQSRNSYSHQLHSLRRIF
jgi:cell wall-associated NlpC family hydrolase